MNTDIKIETIPVNPSSSRTLKATWTIEATQDWYPRTRDRNDIFRDKFRVKNNTLDFESFVASEMAKKIMTDTDKEVMGIIIGNKAC